MLVWVEGKRPDNKNPICHARKFRFYPETDSQFKMLSKGHCFGNSVWRMYLGFIKAV